jgi:hypothetical protein
MSVKVEQVIITPQMAQEWLGVNKKNRRVTVSHVRKLENMFRKGEMELNGQTVKISNTGVLLDGQHRLMACANTGIPFPCLVVRGLPDDVFDTIDTGSKPRGVADVFSIVGETNCGALAAAVRCLFRFKQSLTFYDGGLHSATDTPRDCQDLLAKHPGLRESVLVMGGKQNFLWRTAHAVVLHYLFTTSSSTKARDFADVLVHGSADTGRPFNVFRESMMRMRSLKGRLDQRVESARAIKAFNAEVNGKRPKLILWKNTEDFPKIVGLNAKDL